MATTKAKELTVAITNEPGAAAQALAFLSGAKINMKAVCGWGQDAHGAVMFVAEDPATAARLLKKAGYKVVSNDVVITDMADKPGTLSAVLAKLAAKGINVSYLYGVGTTRPQQVVLRVPSVAKAISALK